MNPTRAILTSFIAAFLAAISFLCSAFASVVCNGVPEILPWQVGGKQFIQITLPIDTTSPTPHVTATAKVGVGNLALQGETVPQARGNVPRISCYTANGNTTSWSYDANNRMTARTLPAGQQESFQYDVSGNLIGHTDFANAGSSYAYCGVPRSHRISSQIVIARFQQD